jgi:hypothetical protein
MFSEPGNNAVVSISTVVPLVRIVFLTVTVMID